MDLVSIVIIAFGLSMDSFAVSVSSGLVLPDIRFRKAIIIAFSLAFFQGLMPFIGWNLGLGLIDYLNHTGYIIAFLMLTFLSVKMIIESLKKEEKRTNFNPLNPTVLLTMSVATSIDALILGMSLAFIGQQNNSFWFSIFLPVMIIGSVTFIMSMLGILFGKKVGLRFGKKMEMLGGILLFLIGLRILAEHFLF